MPPPLALILFVVVQLVPGWVASSLLPTLGERLSLTARVATAVALSLAQLVFIGLVLISLGIATPAVIVAVNVMVTGVLAVVTRRQLRRDWTAAAAAAGSYRPEWESVVVVAILATVVGISVFKAVQNVPANTAVWGYAADTAEILEAGGFPDTNLQYGEEVPFVATKAGGFAWLGAMRAFTGIGFTRSLQLLPLALMFGGLVATWAVFRSFTGRLGAALGVFLLFFEFPAHTVLVAKYSRLTIEAAGMTLGLLAVWAAIAADAEQVPQLRWLAAVMIVLAGLTHGVTLVMAVVFIASYQLARIILGKLSWRQIYRNVFVLGVAPGLGLLLGLRLWSRTAGIALSGGGYELVNGVGDPTLALRRLLNGRSILAAAPPRTGFRPGDLFDSYIRAMFNAGSPLRDVSRQAPIVIVLLAVALIAITWLVGHRQAALTAAIFLSAIFLIGIVFMLRYDLHVFRTHPLRREFKYGGVAVVGLAVAAASGWRWRTSRVPQGLALALVTALVAGSVGLAWIRAPRKWTGGGLSSVNLAALDWVREETPEGSLILTNVRSTASFSAYAQRNSLTEGDTPYIYPERLTTTLALVDSAQSWFAEPDLAFLEENRIDYVIAVRGRGKALGGGIYAPLPSLEVLDAQPYLVREDRFGRVVIYSVQP